MTTRCLKLYQEHHRIKKDMRAAMKAAAEEEFPVGSTVKYVYSYDKKTNEAVYRKAVVVGHTEWNIRLKGPSGGDFTRYAEDLLPDTQDATNDH
jgi:hypothetical protein